MTNCKWAAVRRRGYLDGKATALVHEGDALMRYRGFEERIRASHHVYRKADVAEKVNLQRDDGNAKPYQVRQVRRLILKYEFGGED